MLLLGGTVVFAVERLARKGRRNAGGKTEVWEENWIKARRIIGASIFFFFLGGDNPSLSWASEVDAQLCKLPTTDTLRR